MHGHYPNRPIDLTANAVNAAHVFVCMMVYSGASRLYAAQNFQDYSFEALDPNNVIPTANALLIFGDHSELAITRSARVAVRIA